MDSVSNEEQRRLRRGDVELVAARLALEGRGPRLQLRAEPRDVAELPEAGGQPRGGGAPASQRPAQEDAPDAEVRLREQRHGPAPEQGPERAATARRLAHEALHHDREPLRPRRVLGDPARLELGRAPPAQAGRHLFLTLARTGRPL